MTGGLVLKLTGRWKCRKNMCRGKWLSFVLNLSLRSHSWGKGLQSL